MTSCAGCSAEVPDGTTVCPACGMPSASDVPTLCDIPTPALFEHGSPFDRGRSRFAAGTVLASRYRIVTALGRGGMGEVYRADDLKLNQTVALKFLPTARTSDAVALARLRQEVRLARQISHPGVCRVFDLAEIDGQSFLCMEYIDGEDLASLLRRIGRLPVDKALEIARQVAAGLAAIHDGGLLHRDLKPGNVMIDGRGRARITDFGLAILVDQASAGRQAGTPSYMAPEQHAGHEASSQTDLYAFGLVVYEMLAGHPAWSAEGGPERPTLPASVAEEVDARIRTVLLRCLESEPARRPSSVLQVAAALTGRDLLALAVADGLTLSPEAVVAASRSGSLRPAIALTLLLATLAGLGAVIALSGKVQTFRQIPSPHPPDVLADRAQGLLRELGIKTSSRNRASGFVFDRAYDRYLTSDLSTGAMRRLLAAGRPPSYVFWYRTSPDLLLPAEPSVTPDDPPRKTAGESYVELDLEGRLRHLEVIPAGNMPAESTASQPNWSPLLTAAGFDAAQLKTAPPQSPPPVFADRRAAWEAVSPGSPSLPLRIEAAACQGTPVWFEITGPWGKYSEPKPGHLPTGAKLVSGFRLAFEWTVLLTGFLLARRNLRLGRGDLRGAFRLAVFAFSMVFLGWLIDPSHVLIPVEERFNSQLGISLLQGLIVWTFFLGFEPSVRRLWPERIVSWNRMLAGRFRDPLVGRDVLIGCLLGLGKVLFRYARELPKTWAVERRSLGGTLSGNLQNPIQHVPQIFFDGLFLSLEFMLLFLVLRILLRQEKLTTAALWALLTLGLAIPGPYTGLNLVWSGLGALLVVVAYVRFGPLAGSALWVTYLLCILYPLTLDTTLWYAGGGLFAVLVIVALALYGFATSVAGQPWFTQSTVLDD